MQSDADFLNAVSQYPRTRREKIAAAILSEEADISTDNSLPDLLTDAELADLLRIKLDTLYKHLRHGPPRRRARNVIDIRTIRHVRVGGRRRWLRDAVLHAINTAHDVT